MISRSPKRSRSRSPSRSSRGPPSYNSTIQDRPQRFYQPRFGEREFREGREQNYHRGGHRGGQSRGHNPNITCHTCGEKGHISSQCSNQNSQQDRRRVQQFRRASPAQKFGGYGADWYVGSTSPAQSPRRSLDNSRSRDTDFGKSERLSRLAESPNMQGDTYGKSAEEIQMENIMGFSGFHQSREKYFEEQSTTLGSVKAGFSPKYDKFFPPKSEFDSPTRKESKETKSRESSFKKASPTKSESQKRSIFDSPTRRESQEATSREPSKKTSHTESESKRTKLESTKPPTESAAPKKPKPSSTQSAPQSEIQNQQSKFTEPPILEEPAPDLVVALIIDELIKQIFDKVAESENHVGLIIEDLVKQICDKAAESEKWNYESMHAHFTSRIQKICKLSSAESLTVANAMIKACKEAFPCLNSDLRAHYLSAKMELEGLKENNNNDILPNFSEDERSKVMVSGAKSAQELWLLDFRQSIHSQLSKKVQDKQANLYSFSEIVDLILSYFSV